MSDGDCDTFLSPLLLRKICKFWEFQKFFSKTILVYFKNSIQLVLILMTGRRGSCMGNSTFFLRHFSELGKSKNQFHGTTKTEILTQKTEKRHKTNMELTKLCNIVFKKRYWLIFNHVKTNVQVQFSGLREKLFNPIYS